MVASRGTPRFILPVRVVAVAPLLPSVAGRAETDMTAESTARADIDTPAVPPPRTPQTDEADERPPAHRWLRWLPRYTWSGTVGAVLFGCASLTPSLLPRGWVLQAIIAGVTAAIGYGVGVTIAWFVAELSESRMTPAFRRRAWQVLAAAGALL